MASFASLGLPLLAGFIGEYLCLLGSFQVASLRGLAAASLLGVLFTAAFFLIMMRRVFFSPARKQWDHLPDMNARELLTVVPLLALALILGLYPALLLNPLTQAFNGQF